MSVIFLSMRIQVVEMFISYSLLSRGHEIYKNKAVHEHTQKMNHQHKLLEAVALLPLQKMNY